jgi:DNA-binding transcriptional MerR regulator
MGTPDDCLRIGDFARLGGTNLRTLRYYEQLGLLSPMTRSEGGFRYYRRADVARLRMIRDLQALGLELAQIGELIDTRPDPDSDGSPPRAQITARVRKALLERKRLIDAHIEHLEAERRNVGEALHKLLECERCEHSPGRANNFCQPCSKTGNSLPNDLSALY